MVTCPLCDTDIDLEEADLEEDDLVTCDECGGELRVVGVGPLELEPLEEEEDDEDRLDFEDEDDEDGRWR